MNSTPETDQRLHMALCEWPEYLGILDKYYELFYLYYDADWSNTETQTEYSGHLKLLLDEQGVDYERKMMLITHLTSLLYRKFRTMREENHSPDFSAASK
jgi:hypothetical protein